MIIGLVMGGVATGFMLPLRLVEEWIADADPATVMMLVPIAPAIGGLLTGIVLIALGEKGRAPGVSAVMYAIRRRQSKLDLRFAFGKWIASTLTIGSGGSAGAEGPIVTIGSVIGSNIARLFRASPQHTATLLGCGAAAGIASVFNAPIAGIFFVLEVLLRDFSLRTFTPIVIAAVISAAFTQSLLGNEALFATRAEFSVGAFSAIELPNYLVLGALCGALAAAFARGLTVSENLFAKLPGPRLLKPAIGAAILGAIGIGSLLLIRSSHGMPSFYGNGYPVIKQLLSPAYYLLGDGQNLRPAALFWLIAALTLLKVVGTWLTIGSGGSGGLFAPSLMLGACTGGAFGYLMTRTGWFPAANPAHYALVGMAAMVASTTHAPLTAILLVYEITQSYDIILPLMLAAVISTIVGRLIYPESVYTYKLTQAGIRIGGLSDLTVLQRMTVADVPLVRAVTLRAQESALRLMELSEQHLARDFVVVDDAEEYVGIVTVQDVSAALVYREAIPLLSVIDICRTDLPIVQVHETLDIVLEKFTSHDVHCLAVMGGAGGRKVKGLISRSRLMEHYQAALVKD